MEHSHNVWLLLTLSVLLPSSQGLSVTAVFNRHGIRGTVTFNQTDINSTVEILAQLLGLSDAGTFPIPWAIHTLPFPPSAPDPCQSVAGIVYRSLPDLMETQEHYSSDNITLYGAESVVGRSLVISFRSALYVCATINYAGPVTVQWAPFRADDITNGNVFLWQQTIYFNLTTSASSSLLPWAIVPGGDCNPTMVGGACSNDNGTVCVDQGVRNGNLTVSGVRVQEVVTDPDLVLDAAENVSLVLGGEGSSSCAPILPYPPLRVVAEVGDGGLELMQQSPLHFTEVTVTGGLSDMQYTIHTLSPRDDCTNTGGIFDPWNVGNSSQGVTFDDFPFGDLSMKFGAAVSYCDPYLPLSGSESVVGRALVVMDGGSLVGCGLLRYAGEAIQMRATFAMDGFHGIITFSQPANNPLADTVITIETNITADVAVFSRTPSPTPSLSFTPLTPSPIFTPSPSFSLLSTLPPVAISLSTSLPQATPTPSLTIQDIPEASLPSMILPFPATTSLSPLLVPLASSPLLMPDDTVMPNATENVEGEGRRRREAAEFSWSLRQWDGSGLPSDCAQLPTIGSPSSGACSPLLPLSCTTGDLTDKHGLIPFGQHRTVLHDPYLPLSGPDGVASAVLLVQPANGIGDSACVVLTMVTTATPTATTATSMTTTVTSMATTAASMATSVTSITTPTPTPLRSSRTLTSRVTSTSAVTARPTTSPPQGRTGIDNAVLIGAAVGGVVTTALVLTGVLLLVYVCVHKLRRHRVDLTKQGKSGADVELGRVKLHREPRIGSDQYRAVCPYKPQQDGSDDLPLERGEWVTLLEAPYGGEWWRGQASAGEGWFPKSHVEYVDRETERKKAEEANFKLAAAAIVAASSSFNDQHRSLVSRSNSSSSNRHRSTTAISKSDINSAPVMTARFDSSALDSAVLENEVPVSTGSSSRSDTPRNVGGSDVISNHVGMETGNSQGSSDSSTAMRLEPYIAKYNYVGGTDIELPLQKGEMVSVLEKARSGWWQGVCTGKVGWFPASYVKPAPAHDERGGREKRGRREEGSGLLGMEESLRSETVDATEYRAIHTFSSQQDSDLTFVEGDSVLAYWVHDNGWWYGSCGSRQGWFPGTYVEPNVDASESGSAAPSPLPQLEPQQVGPQVEEGPALNKATASLSSDESPSRKPHRKKWSLKRTKSWEEKAAAGLIPLLPPGESEVKGETSPKKTKPRRKAPPPPVKAMPQSGEEIPLISYSPSLTATSPSLTATSPATPTDEDSQEQAVAKQPKRSTILDPNKPRRLPPAPPTSLTTPETPPTKPKPPSSSETEGVSKKTPLSGGATPVAPPRCKAKVKRVKRPATRLIPPPPSIPLPPPPTRAVAPSPVAPAPAPRPPQPTATKSAPATALPPVSEAVREEAQAAVVEVLGNSPAVAPVKKTIEAGKQGESGDGRKMSNPMAKPKPPQIKPKPAHLSKILSESSVLPHTRPSQGSPKPLPPTRSSSLLQPQRPQRRQPKTPLTAVADSEEAVDSPTGRSTPDLQETADAVRNLRSAPPKHAPPPRPDTTADGESTRRRSNPPSFPPPQRPSTTETTQVVPSGEVSRSNSIKAKGSQLMRSLKKIVQRSEEEEDSGQRSPTRDGVKGEVIQNLQTESPAPLRRKLSEEVGSNLPVRPPPPKLPRQNSGDHKKVTPSRPPPPRKQSSTTSDSKQEVSTPDSAHKHTTSSLPASAGQSPVHSNGSSMSPSRSTSPQPPSTFYRARSEYTAQSPSELTLHVGDILVEIDRPTPAMHYGMLDNGTTGLYPTAAVEPLVTPASKK